jgi:NADPH:quinone reductase-like Zn-dependent oxidoreductase
VNRATTPGPLTPVPGRTYPLADIAAALRYVQDGHGRGKVAITVF